MESETKTTTGDPCQDPTCRVAYWTDVIARSAWQDQARSLGDARLALGSAELICTVFHQKTSKLCTCRRLVASAPGFEHLVDSLNCIIHDPMRAHEAARVRARLIETMRRSAL